MGLYFWYYLTFCVFGKKIKRKERHKLLLVEESEEQEISPLLDLRYTSELLDPLFIIGEIMKMKKKNWDKYPFTIHLAKGTCIEKT